LAPKKFYTKANPDLEPVAPVFDLEKILQKEKEKIPDPFYYLDKNLSLPKDRVQSIDDLEFDTLFENSVQI